MAKYLEEIWDDARVWQRPFAVLSGMENKLNNLPIHPPLVRFQTFAPFETQSECGFLSNREEAEKLATDIYQEKVAWNIHMGIMKYLNGVEAEEAIR